MTTCAYQRIWFGSPFSALPNQFFLAYSYERMLASWLNESDLAATDAEWVSPAVKHSFEPYMEMTMKV